jgi:hypothetical protein
MCNYTYRDYRCENLLFSRQITTNDSKPADPKGRRSTVKPAAIFCPFGTKLSALTLSGLLFLAAPSLANLEKALEI